MRVPTTTAAGPVDALPHDLVDREFSQITWTNFSGQVRNIRDWATIVVTRAEHQVFTNAWRRAIPYGAGTRSASRTQIEGAARQIYADYPEILKALGLG